MGAHGLGGIDKTDVALNGGCAYPFDSHGGVEAGNGARRDEVRRRGGVRFDVNLAGRLITAALRDDETFPALALDVDAKACQQVECDLDVGLGDQFAFDFNGQGAVL